MMKAVYSEAIDDTRHIAGEYVGTISEKGQVMVPAPIRSFLHVKASEKIAFAVSAGKVVVQRPSRLSLEDTFGAVTPMKKPEDFTKLHDIAIEEHRHYHDLWYTTASVRKEASQHGALSGHQNKSLPDLGPNQLDGRRVRAVGLTL